MGKEFRGKALWKLPSRGRGTCPVCQTERTKLLYEIIISSDEKIMVCKRCQHKKIDNL